MSGEIVGAIILVIAFKFSMRLLANKLDSGSAWHFDRYGQYPPPLLPASVPQQNEAIDAYYERMDEAHRLPQLPPLGPAKRWGEDLGRRWQHDLAAREQRRT